jgi:CopG family transcriptional regulator, nickel-responsive regulator
MAHFISFSGLMLERGRAAQPFGMGETAKAGLLMSGNGSLFCGGPRPLSFTRSFSGATIYNKGSTMKKDPLCRFSISMHRDLVSQLDHMSKARGFANRSQAIADMVRAQLVEHRAETASEIAGTITLVYDHHKRNLQSVLTGIQHDHGGLIISAMHVHLDHHNCLEVIAVRGAAGAIQSMADRLTAAKGVKHGKLTVTTTGREFR